MCSDAGVESDKTLAQIKEKWRTVFEKYKEIVDHNSRTGNDPKTFPFYDDVDEFMSASDRANPKHVKESKVPGKSKTQNSERDNPDTDDPFEEMVDLVLEPGKNAKRDCGEGESKPEDETQNVDRPHKKKRKGATLENSETENGILTIMEAQHTAIQKSEEKDERMLEALLKSQADAQRMHQEFTMSVLDKLGQIFSSKQ